MEGKESPLISPYLNNSFRFSPSSAVSVLDYKVSDLRKQLDKLKSKNSNHSKYLDVLLSESGKMKEKVDKEVSPRQTDPKKYLVLLIRARILQ